jgi:hypothetical protein
MKIETQKHYGCNVETNIAMDILRRDQCLCLNCKGELIDMDSKEFHKCPVAQKLYEICQQENIALMVTRCPNFWQESYDEGLCGKNG